MTNSKTIQTTDAMRWLLWIAGALVWIEGAALNLLPLDTETWFAWTPEPTMTTLFLGSGYWAAVIFEWGGARERRWPRASLAVPTVLVFTTLTLIATLLSLGRFQTGPDHPFTAQVASWAWIVVYVVVPPWMSIVLYRQVRATGDFGLGVSPLPRWLVRLLNIQAVSLLVLGIATFVAPRLVSDTIWPWQAMVLCMQAMAAWLIAIAVFAFHAARHREPAPYAFIAYATLALLHFSALARFGLERDPATGVTFIDWSGPSVWVYIILLATMLLAGVAGWHHSRRETALG